MNKTALWKDILREIWQSKSRFISIFALILLGVAFFVGLKATGPDMIQTAHLYYQKYNLADTKVQSTYGIDETDIKALKQIPEIKAIEPVFTIDLLLKKDHHPIKIYSYDTEKKSTVDGYQIKKGRLPKNNNEIALDDTKRMHQKYSIGETITLTNEKNKNPDAILKKFQYKVVGFVSTPTYIEKVNRGKSGIGSGQTDAIAVIPKSSFKTIPYTTANLTFKNTTDMQAYSNEYNTVMHQNKKIIASTLKKQSEKRFTEIKHTAQKQIINGEKKIQQMKTKLTQGQTKLIAVKKEIDSEKTNYESKKAEFNQAIKKSATELEESKQKLNALKQKINTAEANIIISQKKIKKTHEQLKISAKQIEIAEQELAAKQKSLNEEKKVVPPEKNLINFEKKYQQSAKQVAIKKEEQQRIEKNISQKERELKQGQRNLTAVKIQYDKGQKELNLTRKKFQIKKQLSEDKFAKIFNQLNAAEMKYNSNKIKFDQEKQKASAKIYSAEMELAASQKKLTAMKKPQYYVLDRTNNPGYSEYKENADRLASLSTVFPVFFFLIAALVSLATMTRMVEERRTQMGTLKALGYSNLDIMNKFLIYGFLASMSGAIIGLILGFTLFPKIIFNAYRSMYNLPPITIQFYLSDSVVALFTSLVCTTIITYTVCRSVLNTSAAGLMRPKAPKRGKRILLEQIPFVWRKMNFINKVTARNIFRYKQRMLMTIFGVAGCAALILTGFGLRDSISGIATRQYGELFKYHALITKDKNAVKTAKEDYEKLLQDNNITERLKISLTNMESKQTGKTGETVTVSTPENTKAFSDFIKLSRKNTKQNGTLTKNGAIITEKLANLYHLSPGSKLYLKDAQGEYQVKITAIAENYVGHYLYMSKEYYEKVFHKKANYNTDLLKLKNQSTTWKNQYEEKLTKNPLILNVSYSSKVSKLLTKTLDNLNVVVFILIISAALLAFIVLYNLTNINVSERIRELSTIKVLGFYPKEVTMYVYRENIFLTLLGILFGFVLGYFLHQYVIATAEVNALMFSPVMSLSSYFFAAIMTFSFATAVMVVMHVRLKRIDMIEALKSVD